jgi:hypothetical protein
LYFYAKILKKPRIPPKPRKKITQKVFFYEKLSGFCGFSGCISTLKSYKTTDTAEATEENNTKSYFSIKNSAVSAASVVIFLH